MSFTKIEREYFEKLNSQQAHSKEIVLKIKEPIESEPREIKFAPKDCYMTVPCKLCTMHNVCSLASL